MRSKPILLTIVFSAFIIACGAININIDGLLPYKTSYKELSIDAQKQVTCLAENIYFEAGYEPNDGKKAVAFVTLNRVKTGNYANTICDVVYQKTGKTCQFSWYCDKKFTDRRLTIKETPLYYEIRELATHMVVNHDKLKDLTDGATFYHADYVNPKWKLERVDQIGRHIFYKHKGDEIDRNKDFF